MDLWLKTVIHYMRKAVFGVEIFKKKKRKMLLLDGACIEDWGVELVKWVMDKGPTETERSRKL